MIVFACIAPHAPIFLPTIGSEQDRMTVKKTIDCLELLGKKLKDAKPDSIIISSPHKDWGFNVPLYFLAPDFKGNIETYLTGLESPAFYFKEGKKAYDLKIKNSKLKIGLVASGDMSHVLKEDGPYGFHPEGPRFDKELIEALKRKDIAKILRLDDDYPEAADCGLGSFSFLLGMIDAHSKKWQAEILSYEGPFGVGYLVVNFKL